MVEATQDRERDDAARAHALSFRRRESREDRLAHPLVRPGVSGGRDLRLPHARARWCSPRTSRWFKHSRRMLPRKRSHVEVRLRARMNVEAGCGDDGGTDIAGGPDFGSGRSLSSIFR